MCLKPIGTPMARNPYQTWCQSRHPSPSEDLHFGSHRRETHCVSPNSHNLFFLILPILAAKPTDSFNPQNPSPSPSSLYLPIWMPLLLSSGKWGPWLSIVMLYFDNEVESALFWHLDYTSIFLKMWFVKIWMRRNVTISIFDFNRSILRFIGMWDNNVWFIFWNLKWIIYFFHFIIKFECKLASPLKKYSRK